ncbi:glutamine amidotransferase-related protein, partial [Acinetobacter baumannii]|uniref:glutamine amidotransferase-related protein n=1 Tax=Acinetobacter baumannii TaxID=470 RepID=UPI000AD20565
VSSLKTAEAILVPVGFGERGTERKMKAIQYARENGCPFLGSFFSRNFAVSENARHVAGMPEASATEYNRSTKYPLIVLITEWLDERGELR